MSLLEKADIANSSAVAQFRMMHRDPLAPLSFLIGSRLTCVKAREYDWAFEFADGTGIVAESSHWRLLDGNTVIVTDEDHGQLFGLAVPVDAAGVVYAELDGATLCLVQFSKVSDLMLSFTNGRILEFLISSAGYENWHIYGPDKRHTFAIGGGKICEIG